MLNELRQVTEFSLGILFYPESFLYSAFQDINHPTNQMICVSALVATGYYTLNDYGLASPLAAILLTEVATRIFIISTVIIAYYKN